MRISKDQLRRMAALEAQADLMLCLMFERGVLTRTQVKEIAAEMPGATPKLDRLLIASLQ